MSTYYNPRTGLNYRILGLIDEDDRYEVYHLRAPHNHDLILHVLKNGNGRRFEAKKLSAPVPHKITGATATRSEAIMPWVGDENNPTAREL